VDDRFPLWLRRVVGKLDFIGVPNLGALLCGIAVVAFFANLNHSVPLDRFIFDPELVRQGQWWRLFTFIFTSGFSNPINLIFYVLYLYFVMNALESLWGAGPLTVYILLSYLCCLLGAFIADSQVDISYYILTNVSLAFGTLLPDYQLLIYFILPVKAKWLALLGGAFIIWQIIGGNIIIMPLSLIPYVLFFSPLLVKNIRSRIRISQNRKRFDDDMWK
jgi:hypothetical protein